ncbi:CpaF family protein [Lachnospiraceae bacterium OttesenSCG-928-D06]|nr:CpaF family protein [Lachnospiraceae bacterium OttesenSCG-928-D06]
MLRDDEKFKDIIATIVEEKVEIYLTTRERIDLEERIFSEFRGLGVLDTLLRNEDITEVMINGAKNIFIEKKGRIERVEQTYEDENRLRDVVQRIVRDTGAGREINDANPIVDTRLRDGSRVNIVLSPIARLGHAITIRKFSKEPMTMEKLLAYGSLTEEIADILKKLVEARYNIFICGGTGSGKTTFLNALSNYIPKQERIITIEDSAELQITGVENLISLETRNKNSAGKGEISIRDLIKSSLRMRPDRIVVGEVRGGEALDMLQAMNTGHDGSLSTGHANSTKDMMSRLETMVLQGSEGLPLKAVRQQITSALDIVVHLSRLRDHSRRTMEISEVIGLDENDNYIINSLYEFYEDELTTPSKVSGKLTRTENRMINTEKLEAAGIYIKV